MAKNAGLANGLTRWFGAKRIGCGKKKNVRNREISLHVRTQIERWKKDVLSVLCCSVEAGDRIDSIILLLWLRLSLLLAAFRLPKKTIK